MTKIKNITDVKYGIIIQQVNCKGVMASGVARDIAAKWPVVREKYSETVTDFYKINHNGTLLGSKQLVQVEPDLWVVNIFSQDDYGRDGRRYTDYQAMSQALESLRQFIDQVGIQDVPIYYPLIGCGLGGGNWEVVKGIIESTLGGLNHTLVTKDDEKEPS